MLILPGHSLLFYLLEEFMLQFDLCFWRSVFYITLYMKLYFILLTIYIVYVSCFISYSVDVSREADAKPTAAPVACFQFLVQSEFNLLICFVPLF